MTWVMLAIRLLTTPLADPGVAGVPYEKLTLIGALCIAVVAFLKGWIVPGWVYRDVLASNERLRAQNLELRRLANTTATAAERVVDRASPPPPPPDSGD